MKTLKLGLCPLAVVLMALASPARAASSAASASSEGASASVGSVSTSFEKSSASSRKGKDVAAGEYRVIDVAAAADRPGHVRLQLQALAAGAEDNDVVLILPQAAAAQALVAVGEQVSVLQRPYGLEFARADTQQAFFLVLHDNWYRELQTKALSI